MLAGSGVSSFSTLVRVMRLALVPPQVVERLRRDQAALDSTLELIASVECLAHYVRDKGPFTPEESWFATLRDRFTTLAKSKRILSAATP